MRRNALTAASLIMNLPGEFHTKGHPDGLVQGVYWLLDDIGWELVKYLDWSAEYSTRAQRKLQKILEACSNVGARIGPKTINRIPNPDDPKWRAQAMRSATALQIEHPHNCIGSDDDDTVCELKRYSDPDDPESIAWRFEKTWPRVTSQPSPITGAPLIAAIRDLQARLYERWPQFDPQEKAKQIVMACLRKAGERKPSAFFDAERKAEQRRRTIALDVRPSSGQKPSPS